MACFCLFGEELFNLVFYRLPRWSYHFPGKRQYSHYSCFEWKNGYQALSSHRSRRPEHDVISAKTTSAEVSCSCPEYQYYKDGGRIFSLRRHHWLHSILWLCRKLSTDIAIMLRTLRKSFQGGEIRSIISTPQYISSYHFKQYVNWNRVILYLYFVV